MRFEGEAYVARRQWWWVATVLVSTAGFAATVALTPGASLASVVAAFAALAVMSVLLLVRIKPRKPKKRSRVTADARGVFVDGKIAVPRDTLARAYAEIVGDGTHAVHVDAKGWLRSCVFHVDAPEHAEALVAALELDRGRRIARFDALPPWAHRIRWLTILLTTSPWVLFNLLRHLPGWGMALVFLAYTVIALPVVMPQKIEVGEDGVLLRWLGRRRFIPFQQIQGVSMTELGVELDLGADQPLEIRLTQRAEDAKGKREALTRRIEEGLARYRALDPAEEEALLARGERDVATWIREARELGTAGARGYRALALPRERLWAVLENPGADPSAREGAALALQASLDDAERDRLVAVGERTASPRVRVAIDAVGEGKDEQALREALEAAEAEPAEAKAARKALQR